MLERLDTVCLQVADLERASTWYEEQLGFRVVFVGDRYRVLKIGESAIPLTIEEGKPGHSSTYPIFYTSDVKKTFEKLVEEGVEVGPLEKNADSSYFDLYDLDRNRLQVCHF